MLMSEFAEVKWNSANKKKYVDLGYEFTKMGDTFKVNVNHLTKGSHSLVKVKCDYCGKEYEREYKKYLYCHNKSDNHEDCCEKCIGSKSTKTYKMKHGESYLSNPENQQKLKQSIIDKYGVDNVLKVESIKFKMEETLKEKYGNDYRKTFRKKSENTMLKKYGKKSLTVSGENHYRWNGGKTTENQKGRSGSEYNEWRFNVFKRDNFTCQHCNTDRVELNAHHLEGYAENKDLRYVVDNGITLCEKCHNEFHNHYGRGNNTKSQYIEFDKTFRKS